MFPGVFGPAQWECLKFLAELVEGKLPGGEAGKCESGRDGKLDRAVFVTYVMTLPDLMPCDVCTNHLTENLKLYPLGEATDLRRWVCDVHNAVNRSNDVSEVSFLDVESVREPPLYEQVKCLVIYAKCIESQEVMTSFWTYAGIVEQVFDIHTHLPKIDAVSYSKHVAELTNFDYEKRMSVIMSTEHELALVQQLMHRARDRRRIVELMEKLNLPTHVVCEGPAATVWRSGNRTDTHIVTCNGEWMGAGLEDHVLTGVTHISVDNILAYITKKPDRLTIQYEPFSITNIPLYEEATALRVVGRKVFVGFQNHGMVYEKDMSYRFSNRGVTAISPDGSCYACDNGYILKSHTGAELMTTLDRRDKVTCVDASKDGKDIVYGTEEGRVIELSMSTCEATEYRTPHDPIKGVAFVKGGIIWLDGTWAGGVVNLVTSNVEQVCRRDGRVLISKTMDGGTTDIRAEKIN